MACKRCTKTPSLVAPIFGKSAFTAPTWPRSSMIVPAPQRPRRNFSTSARHIDYTDSHAWIRFCKSVENEVIFIQWRMTMQIYDALKKDHQEVKALLTQLSQLDKDSDDELRTRLIE